ncbi:hypothetical protein HLB44_00515 [Aquincola sp. S2]|uniref:ABC transporter substrate-binding protein n=1 Tax=Pseudaquabacterium terrae TaxID=2732868 RepID=A0ABX2EAD0_9BURK|nr:ABC transporter substrate binding protein [Aquabacterium terrae]NRF65456.1 hypothetical protein [Aquabacterium terrae]
MRRRQLVQVAGACALLGLATRWSSAAPLTPLRKVRLGVLTRTRPELPTMARWWLRALALLQQRGWTVGDNLSLEVRVGADAAALRRAAEELIAAPVDVLYADGNSAALQAVKATSALPIVMQGAGIVELGMAQSLARPGGHVTGIDLLAYDSCGKGLSHLRALRPGLTHIGLPLTRGLLLGEAWYQSWARVAAPIGIEVTALPRVLRSEDIGAMLAAARQEHIQALVVPNLPFLIPTDWSRIQAWAVAQRAVTLGAISDSGATMLAFGPSMTEVVGMAVHQLDQVLRGVRPAEIPIMRPTRFDLVLNRRLANQAGWRMPDELLLQATEVVADGSV